MNYLILAILLLFPAQAFAVIQVYSPEVEQGTLNVEIGAEQQENTDSLLIRNYEDYQANIRYGFSDAFSFGLELNAHDNTSANQTMDYQMTGFEMIYELSEIGGDSPVAAGFRLEYELSHTDDQDDAINGSFLFTYDADAFEFAINLGLKSEIGGESEDGLAGDIRTSGLINFSPMLKPGIAYFSDTGELEHLNNFDDQNNRLGPWVYGDLTENFYYQGGYLFGMTDSSPDNSFVGMLGYKMKLGKTATSSGPKPEVNNYYNNGMNYGY